MSLDIYVGPLSRYHAGEWMTMGQSAAESAGQSFVTIGPGGEQLEPAASQSEVTQAVLEWQDHAVRFITEREGTYEGWLESPEVGYVTDRLGWEGWDGLFLKYAYLLQSELSEPTDLPEDISKDPAYNNVISNPGLAQIFGSTELWLPGSFSMGFNWETITGKKLGISSLGMLSRILDQICELWSKSRAEMSTAVTDQPSSSPTLDESALHGLAVFCRLCDAATEMRQPMILDY